MLLNRKLVRNGSTRHLTPLRQRRRATTYRTAWFDPTQATTLYGNAQKHIVQSSSPRHAVPYAKKTSRRQQRAAVVKRSFSREILREENWHWVARAPITYISHDWVPR